MAGSKDNLKSAETRASFVARAAFAVLLVVGGVAVLVYAVTSHTVDVLVETEVEVEKPPPEVDIMEALAQGLSPEEIDELMQPVIVKEKIDVTESRPERAIVQGVTISGYEMLPSGEIKYAYGVGEEVPDACPT